MPSGETGRSSSNTECVLLDRKRSGLACSIEFKQKTTRKRFADGGSAGIRVKAQFSMNRNRF